MDELLSELEQSITISFLYRTSLEKHLNYEYEYLSNHSASISLFAFQSFSNMPYIISRQLYNTMNTSKNQKLSKEEFINGFITVYFGSIEERLKFLFDFFTPSLKTYFNTSRFFRLHKLGYIFGTCNHIKHSFFVKFI